MNEPKCPSCGAPQSPQDLALKLKTSAERVLDQEGQSPNTHVYVPACELKTVCEQVLTAPAPQAAPEPAPVTASDHELAT